MIRRSASAFFAFLLLFTLYGQGPSAGLVSEHIAALQSRGVAFEPVALFSSVPQSPATDALWSRACYRAVVMRFDPARAADILGRKPQHVQLTVPGANGPVVMDLEKVSITSDDYSVVQASSGLPTRTGAAVHYQGMVHGEPGSIAAISIFPEEVMGLLADADGQRVMGKLENNRDGMHVLYREQDLRGTSGAVCNVLGRSGYADPSHARPGRGAHHPLRALLLGSGP